MFFTNSYSIICLILFASMIGCKEKGNSQVLIGKDSVVVNCYKLNPVKNDSKADSLRDFEFGSESIENFLLSTITMKGKITYDSAMDYVTSFEYQKELLLNHNCFNKLNDPDSCGLINIYFNSPSSTWVKKKSTVQFLQNYTKSIFNFGNATVFEYRFNNVAEIEPHFMYIILKEQTEDEKRYGKNYKGFVICSDGLDWKDYSDRSLSVPLFIQMVRRSKEFYIPLYYDGERFIPVGHFKSKNWEE